MCNHLPSPTNFANKAASRNVALSFRGRSAKILEKLFMAVGSWFVASFGDVPNTDLSDGTVLDVDFDRTVGSDALESDFDFVE